MLVSPIIPHSYASQIAQDWNVPAYGAGFVLRFQIAKNYLSKYEVHIVGAETHSEYWIPAEQLDEFNQHIIGKIEVIREYHQANVAGGS